MSFNRLVQILRVVNRSVKNGGFRAILLFSCASWYESWDLHRDIRMLYHSIFVYLLVEFTLVDSVYQHLLVKLCPINSNSQSLLCMSPSTPLLRVLEAHLGR